MDDALMKPCTAFEGFERLLSGPLFEVALAVRAATERGARGALLCFDDATGHVIDLDLRGTREEIIARLAPPPTAPEPRHRGRPKLGVVAREVTLLPRHWDWLGAQPGGASTALRKLVEEARRANAGKERQVQMRDGAYRFMSALAGDLPGFEEASRALFAGDADRFAVVVAAWPTDVREHARELAFGAEA